MSAPAIPPVAVIADAHVHFPDSDYGGAGLVWQGRRRVWRSWQDTARGSRAVNEAADAFAAVLADVVARGIRQVVLLGDYVDDGQAEATQRLARLLHGPQGLRIFALPGNHDVFAAHGKHTATRFATGPGATRLVTSDPRLAATEPGAILTAALRCHGQPEALRPMAAFGYFRHRDDLHWESPFGASDRPEDRIYPARSADGGTMHVLMDASYLVEPAPGLWLLMIDANAFVPRPGTFRINQKRAFADPSDAGWNALPSAKPHLLPWIADVASRARAGGKVLMAFSHYPALDPCRDAAGHERGLFGDTTLARRTPRPEAGATLAEAGVRLHVSGHLHMAGITKVEGLTEIAVPSLVAFPGGYAILAAAQGGLRATLAALPPVPGDPALAAFYAASGATDAPSFPALLASRLRRAAEAQPPFGWPPEPIQAGGALAMPGFLADWSLLRQGGPLTGAAIPPERLAALRRLAVPTPGDNASRHLIQMLRTSLARFDEGPSITVPLP